VQTAIDTELIEFNNWALRIRPAQSEHPRLLLLIHGFSGDENSMWVFTRGLSKDYWMIAPRAPHASEQGGYSWRSAPLQPGSLPGFEKLASSAEALIKLIDEYAASVKLEARQFDLMGFSQGAAMVNTIGLLYPDRVNKMGVLAGFVPLGADELIVKKPYAGKKIFVAHGTQDQMVPIEIARASIRLLEDAGAKVAYCEDEVGHKLSMKCLHALEGYLQD